MITFTIHRYDHADPSVMRLLTHIAKELKTLADKFDVLVEEVAAERTVVDGVVALLERLDEELADAKDDPAQIEAIRSGLQEQRQRIADAVVAHTPAAAPVQGSAKPASVQSLGAKVPK